MDLTAILDTFPNKNMRSVRDDAVFEMSMYLAPVWPPVCGRHLRGFPTYQKRGTGADTSRDTACRSRQSHLNSKQNSQNASIRLQYVALLRPWRPLEFLLFLVFLVEINLENRLPCGMAELSAKLLCDLSDFQGWKSISLSLIG
ncbi:hypothetical protein N7537_001538 [Penicillium hordei]|uniref:Uncharacterized protein n=1 Tax=Penicillium hordei TaxID=40994 RepID=A0AAD6H8W7_9EURO|nr:uncharacterized protein N7537_001538 [Penicillium hordei]KAJ5616424.1 hypothetical protein N7537_001538 [Penicillium hordei]